MNQKEISTAEKNKLDVLELFSLTLSASRNEKEATFILLEYLAEIDRRTAYAQKAYSSLFEYIVKELNYSESQAAERVNAVRLIRARPEVKAHLKSGSLSLTNAAQVQRFFYSEKKSTGQPLTDDDQKKVITACLGKSKREAEKVLYQHASEPAIVFMNESIRTVSADRSEIKFSASIEIQEKLARIKEITKLNSMEEIFSKALDLYIETEAKKRGLDSVIHAPLFSKSTPPAVQPKESDSEPVKSDNPRYVPVRFKKIIAGRSRGQCEFVDVPNRRRCASRYNLQIDHIKPIAKGGRTTLDNLRHLCPAHNAFVAKEMGLTWPNSS